MRRPDPATFPAPPLPNSYWVEPGRLLAGEYPANPSRADSMHRLHLLLDAGVSYFLDLTEPDELSAYDTLLPAKAKSGGSAITYVRKPIPDHSVPAAPERMQEILTHLERALAARHCVYLHCHAGIGRTGTVVGCYLIRGGMRPLDALAYLNELWRANQQSKVWQHIPETEEQRSYILGWRESERAELAPDTLAAARHLRERFRGTLIGLAVGDALGASVQYRPAGSFPPVRDLTGGGPFELPRGSWSDDTAMALCLAESILERDSFDPADQIARYHRWQHDGHLSSTGHCLGITAAVSKASASARWSGKPFAGSHDPERLDKEALTRVAPVVLAFFSNPTEAIQNACDAARTTHQAPVVLDACRYFAALLVGALQGVPRQKLLSGSFTPVPGLWEERPLKPPIAAIAAGSFHGKMPPAIEGGGTVINALEAVLWALDRTSSFREGALLAVNLGQDADVTGALFGQLAGAIYGLPGVPPAWLATLAKRELIESFADRLLARALEHMAG